MTTEIDRVVSVASRRARMAITADDLERCAPGLAAQIAAHPIDPAVDLLHRRCRTNGYADLRDLADACGVDSWELSELAAFTLRAEAIHGVIIDTAGRVEPARYRVMR